jgi:hypothetical protein
MERRMRTALRIGLPLFVALAALALTTCDGANILAALTTEVMVANNKFLVIAATGPFAANDQAVNPGASLWVQFDRDLDPSSVTPQSIVFSPSVNWTWSYSSATKILTVTPVPFLDSLVTYAVTVGTGLKGTDGSSLQANGVLSFKTKQAPAGVLTINTGGAYTNSPTATLNFVVNGITNQIRWSLTASDINADPNLGNSTLWTSKGTLSFPLPLGADGAKTVYYQLVDATFLNATAPLSASVTLDTAAPVVGAQLSINSGAIASSSTSVTLTSNVTDPTSPIEMQFLNHPNDLAANLVEANWVPYSASAAWTLSAPGTRQVTGWYRDKAGNVVAAGSSDSIIAGAPALSVPMNNHAVAARGNLRASWSVAAPDVGADTYYLYQSPRSAGTWSLVGTGTSPMTFACPTETIYDFALQIANSAVTGSNGTNATYSNVCSSFTSDVVIVYNDDDKADTVLARENLYTVLTNSSNWVGKYGIGTGMPLLTVTCVPQSFLSKRYSAANVIYGYPTITTPAFLGYKNPEWAFDVAGSGRSVVAMGIGGAQMIDTINAYWTKYLEKTPGRPIDLGYSAGALGKSGGLSTYARIQTNNVWATPLSYKPPSDGQLVPQIGKTRMDTWAAVLKDGLAPKGGELYAADPGDYTVLFDVVRQNQFVQYGFSGLPDSPYYGYPFFVNLVALMGSLYP